MHSVQLHILKTLLFNPQARFAELNTSGLTNDHFTFHLKQLLENGLITKEDNLYQLAAKGTEYAGRIDVDTVEIVSQPKLGVAVCIWKKEGDKTFVLVNKRKKQQAKGKAGLHTEKVRLGEKLVVTAERCISQELGDIDVELTFAGVSHVMQSGDDGLALDVVLHCFGGKYSSGEILAETPEGSNTWVEHSEISKQADILPGVPAIVDRVLKSEMFFVESNV